MSAIRNFSWKMTFIASMASGLMAPTMAQSPEGSLPSAPSASQGPIENRPAPGSQRLEFQRAFHLIPIADAPDLGDEHVAALSRRQKLTLFMKTAVDPSTALIAVVGAGVSAKSSAQPAYGGGAGPFGQKVGAIAADYGSNALFSRSLLPILLHQDPRFFRKEDGNVGSRLLYGATRAFVIQTDSGHSTVNTSFLGGYAMSVALSNTYYPDSNRNAKDAAIRYAQGIGIGVAVDVIREFWKLRY